MRLHKDSGWRLFLRTVIARAYPRIIGQQRQKAWLLFDVLLPLIALSAYVFVYRAIGAPEAYVGFVILGGAMILHQAMARLSAPEIVVSTRGIRHGCIFMMAERVLALSG